MRKLNGGDLVALAGLTLLVMSLLYVAYEIYCTPPGQGVSQSISW